MRRVTAVMRRRTLSTTALTGRQTLSTTSRGTALMRRRTLSTTSHDVVVCGGGVVGSSVALHLGEKTGPAASPCWSGTRPTPRRPRPMSAGGIRQQFTTPANVQLSCYGAQFLREVPGALGPGPARGPGPDPVPRGRLPDPRVGEGRFCFKRERCDPARGRRALDRPPRPDTNPAGSSPGSRSTAWASVRSRKNEGYFDPWGLLDALRRARRRSASST